MSERSLLEELETTMRRLGQHARLHREAEAYEAARVRMLYLGGLLAQLCVELRGLRQAGVLERALLGSLEGQQLWRATCQELREPLLAKLGPPGRALLAADLDLLQLVAYTGAAIALARDRRSQVTGRLARQLSELREADECLLLVSQRLLELDELDPGAAASSWEEIMRLAGDRGQRHDGPSPPEAPA